MKIQLSPVSKLLLLATLAGMPALAAAADLDGLARELAAGSRSAGLRRVAVSRLETARGRNDGRAELLTDALTLALVRTGRVQAVERSMISKIAEELKLDRTGAVAGAADREAGLAAVDGLVVGRYDVVGERTRLFVRVIDAQSGVIVAAASAEVAAMEGDPSVRDAVASEPDFRAPSGHLNCDAAAQILTERQETLLQLKARYWAFRLRLGDDASLASADARATIADAEQRSRYMEELSSWSTADVIAPLRSEELAELGETQNHAKELIRDCSL